MMILPGVEQHLTDDDFATLAAGSSVADRVREHLAACDDCHREADELRRTDVYILAGMAGGASVGKHLGADDLLAFLTEAVTGAEALALTRHLASCTECRQRYEQARAEQSTMPQNSLQQALVKRQESLERPTAKPGPPDFGTIRIVWRGRSSQVEHQPPPNAPAGRSVGRFVEFAEDPLIVRVDIGQDATFPQISVLVAEEDRPQADCPVILRAPGLQIRAATGPGGRATLPLAPGTGYITVGVPVRCRFSLVVENER